MDYWVEELKRIEQVTTELYRINPVNFDKLTIHLIKKYVDDVLFSGDKFKPGISWDKVSKTLVSRNSLTEAARRRTNRGP